MTAFTNTLEGGTNGVAISTANSGGASGTAFDSINGTAPTFATSAAWIGLLGMSAQAASGVVSYVGWTSVNSTSLASCFYYKYTTRSVATQLGQFRTAVGQSAGIQQLSSGTVSVADQAGTTIPGSTSPALTNGTTYRVEVEVFSSATVGFVNFRMYVGESTTAFWTFASPATVNTRGGNITFFRLGKITASTDATAFLFDIPKAVDGSTTPIGAASTDRVYNGSTWVPAEWKVFT